MFLYLGLAIIIAAAVLIIIAAKQPDEFRVTRSVSIHAPAATIFSYVNNLHQFQTWSPWAKMDPQAETAFHGPDAGVDAALSWKGKKTGEGRMTLTESIPAERIIFRLDFQKPMRATNQAEFTFVTEGAATRVTWSMTGKSTFISKMMGLLLNCEKMVGTQFEHGLNNLKTLAETK